MKKLRLLFLHLLLLVAVGALAKDFTTSYYTNANGKKGEALKTALCSIITSGHTSIGYDGLYESYKKTDNRVINGTTYVRDWYSTTTRYKHVTDKAGSYSKEGDCYNREHSVPQSWWEGSASSSKLKCDIVHVLPTDGYVNNRRSNYPFGEVGSATYTSNGNYCKLGTAKSDLGYSGTVFEPNDEIKGDIARIYFYMCTRYQSECTGWSNIFTGTTYSPMASWALNMFMRWSENDPVDDIEIARNNAVEDEQGNRNPFVDFPGLEQYVWGDLKTTPISVTAYDDPYDTSGLTTPTFTFNTENVSVVLGDASTLTYQATTNSDGTISYSSSDTSVATVSSSGVITILAAGTTTITASVPATNTYKAASASFILTVKASADDPDTLTGDYVKVTSADDLTDGQYLIVYEDGNLAYDGGSATLNNTGASISVTISDGTIASTPATDAAVFTIDLSAGTIKSASGYYIGNTSSSSNQTQFSNTTAYTNTITYNSTNSCVDIVASCGNYLRYNTSGYFRYYKAASYTSQKAIQLYKKTAGSGTGGDDPTPTGPVDPTVSFTTETLNVMVGDTIVNEADTNSDGMITYTSSNPQVATVDSESGEVIAIAEGTATITASVPATNDYNAGSASYTLTVIAASGDTQVLTDEITATMLELSGSSYSDVSGKTGNSGTIYAANAMKNSNGAIQMRTNNSNSGIVSTYSVGNVSKVTVTWGTGNMSGRTLNIYGSSTPYTSPSDLYDSSKQGTLIGSIVYGTSTELSITSASYPYIGIRSSNSALYADKIKVEWVTNEQSQTEPIAPVFSFENQSANMLTGETYTQTVSTNSDGDVTYSSSNTQVASVDATTGEVTALAEGTVTITASVTGTNIYTAATASYTITVEAAPVTTGDGTATNPYTVADIQLLFSRSLQPSDTIFVRGYVSQIVTIDTSQYGNANYYISDDATTTDQFYVYRGKYLEGERFTSADQLAVGDSVVVKGKVTLFNNQTAEFTQNNYLVIHYRPGETQPEDPTLDVEPAKVALNIGETVQLTVTTNSDGQVTYESEDTSIATVSANGLVTAVSSGVAEITISVAATNTFNAATTSVPVTVVSGETPDEPETLLYETLSNYSASNDGSVALSADYEHFDYDGWGTLTKVYAGGTSNAYPESGGCLKLGTGSATGSMTTGTLPIEGNATLTFYLKQYNTDTGKLNVTVTGATADVTEFTPSSSWTKCTVNLTEGVGKVTITFATSSKRVYLDEIKVVTGSGSESGDEKEDIELQFTETTASATLGEDFTAPSLSANTPAMPVVTYESSDPTVATVDAQTGAVTLVAAGTTVITATFAGDDYYNPATASYTLTVSEGTTPVEPTGDYYYVKVTETPNDWSGTYLIVYEGENESLAFDGSLSTLDAVGNTVSVTISNDTIASTQATDAAAFTIARIEDPTALLYSVQSASGLYIGNTSDANALKASATSAYSNSISLLAATETQPASVGISSSGTYLRYNPTSGQTRFRYFKSSTYTNQQPIQLYQKVFVPSQEEAEPGDVDGDDDLDEADLDILVQILIGNLSTNDYPNADVDGENGVTLSDITRLVNLMRQQQQQSGE